MKRTPPCPHCKSGEVAQTPYLGHVRGVLELKCPKCGQRGFAVARFKGSDRFYKILWVGPPAVGPRRQESG